MNVEDIPVWAHNPQLRKIEKNVLIPRLAEKKINNELCHEEKKLFSDCAKREGFKVVTNCRDPLKLYEVCSNKLWRDEQFWKQMEKEYLEKRQRYQDTGVSEFPSKRRGD